MDLDYLSAVVDEIALEGLDGITISTLWKRLELRPGFVIKLDPKSKAFLWKRLTTVKELEYYELPEPRTTVDIYNRMDFVDPDSGHMVELNQEMLSTDAYPINCINEDGIIGSCSTYHTRKLVTSDIINEGSHVLNLDQVIERFGDTLVIVASQRLRNEALLGKTFISTKSWIDSTYCVLERIGRGRYSGELSAGPVSLEVFNMPSKTLFYHTIKLIKLGLIKKQDISILTRSHKHQLRKIFHLTRFFKVVNSKNFIIATQIATYLKGKPNQRELISKTRNDLHIEEKSFKKVYKIYRKVFKTYLIPYRDLFPDAKEKDFMTKSKMSEKHLRVIECTRMPNSVSEEESDEEEDTEPGEEEETERELKPYSYIFERPMLYQGLMAVESAGPQGVNRAELTKMMGLDYYDGRAMCKALVRSGSVIDVIVDLGKVKRIQYVAKKFKDESKILKEYYSEQDKFMELIKQEPGGDVNRTGSEDASSQDESQSDIAMELSAPVIKTEAVVEVLSEVMAGLIGQPSTSAMEDETPPAEHQPVGVGAEQFNDRLPSMVTHHSQEIFPEIKSEEDMKPTKTRRSQRRETVMTGKHFKRLSWILEAVRDAKLIENVFHLMKSLRAKEKAEGSTFMIDKKTLYTLLNILVNQGKVRCIKTVICLGDNTKTLQYYCDPSIQPTDNIVKSAIEQAKLKSFSVSKESIKHSKEKEMSPAKSKDILKGLPDSARESIAKLHEFKSKLKPTDMVYDKKCAKLYGYKAKMQRARIIHQLLWYLIYGYQGNEQTRETTQQEGINAEGTVSGKEDTPTVYLDEMSWKKYLAPLPQHRGYPKGWCLISDVLLSLPLCLFCALVHISYKIDGLLELLNDPVKCLYPISYLPCSVTQRLLFARKYIYAFHENCVRICHMGLLSFGSSNNKEKDQIFIYLHQTASLMDTTHSLQGYYKTRMPAGHEPETRIYHFTCNDTVEQYWIDLKHFAFSSNLGHKLLTDNDKEESREGEGGFLTLEDAQSPKTPATVIDDGIIPGDGRGPAGLDSNMYIHLGRNWSWNNLQSKPKTSAFTDSLHGVEDSKKPLESENVLARFEERKQMTISSSPPRTRHQPKERITLIGGKKGHAAEVVQVTVAKTRGNKGGKGIKRKLTSETKLAKKKLISKTKVKKIKRGRRPKDEKDMAALDQMTGQRVQWSAKEDGLLLTCKIASLVMDKNSRGMLIPWVVVRDILYKYAAEESADKSSAACQRRVAHSLKNPVVKQNLSIFYAEAIQDQRIKKYMNCVYTQGSEETIKIYGEVVDILIKKFASADVKECTLPDNLDLLKKFSVSVINPTVKPIVFTDPSNKIDVLENAVRNIFHSYVSVDDKQGRSHEMYHVLSQYPDKLLEKVLNKMRADGLIVRMKKNEQSKIIETGIHGVKLSQRYSYRFQSRFPSSIFEESLECLNKLMDCHKLSGPQGKVEMDDLSKGGYCACFIGLFALGKLAFHIRIPRDIIILDPSLNQSVSRGVILSEQNIQDPSNDSDEDMETGQTDDASDTSSVTDSLIGRIKKTFKKQQRMENTTSSVDTQKNDIISRCSMGQRSIIEYEEDSRVHVGTKRSSLASRALITMRRSRSEDAHRLKVYNVQDNFVINRCSLWIGIDEGADRLCQECTLEQIPLEEANNTYVKQSELGKEKTEDIPLWKKKRKKKPDVPSELPELTLMSSKVAAIKQRLTKTLPFQLDIDEEWDNFDPLQRQNLQQIFNTIDQHGELGVSIYTLKKLFSYSNLLLPCLKCLEEEDMYE